MRKQLLLSTGTICLMLASGYALAQAPNERRDEPKRTEEPAKGGAARMQERGGHEQMKGAQEKSAQERGGLEHSQRTQGAATQHEEKGTAGREATEERNKPSTAERNGTKAGEQAQESRHGNREAEGARESGKEPGKQSGKEAGKESGKQGANENAKEQERTKTGEVKGEKTGPQKSTAESEKSKTGSEATRSEHGTATGQNERGEPRNAAEQQREQGNRPATANETTRPTNNNAQNTPSSTTRQGQAQTNERNGTQANQQINQQAGIAPDKQVRISETMSRQHLAEPERNLNISIRVGEAIPPRVRLHRLPPEIVSIEPEYRDYDYFTTEDDIVIVEPGTHRVVSEVPRDPARARAELRGGSMAATSTGGGGAPCRVMRRDASGNVAEASPSTVGSTARQDSLSVTVQTPEGGSMPPVALGAPAGDIVVATQGQGDCTITIEPQTR